VLVDTTEQDTGRNTKRGVFFLNLPLALTALFLGARSVPAAERRQPAVDLPGQLLGIAGLGLLAGALVQAGRAGWTSPLVPGGFCVAIAVLGVALLGSMVRSRADFIPGLHAGLAVPAAAFLTGVLITLRGVRH
jgi:MFS transporter, DHA2 family, methylenomycin A resistance protein